MPDPEMTGSEALAHGILTSGARFVTGYPGSPATATVEALLRLAPDEIQIEWAINEKSAFDAAFGASLAGVRTLVCLKSVGLNVALDSLMVSNLAPGDGAFVLLVGDDPGGWGSQNEEDSRPLVAAAEVPLLEPTSVTEAALVMRHAFVMSERYRVPVVLHITRAFAQAQAPVALPDHDDPPSNQISFQRQPERFNVLPIAVVPMHQKLQATLGKLKAYLENHPLNSEQGQGSVGVIAAGYAFAKLDEVLRQSDVPPLHILRLGTLNPLPPERITAFLRPLEAVLVLEDGLPYVETQVRALAQQAGLTLPIYGRRSGQVPTAGELFAPQIAAGLAALLPDWPWPGFEPQSRAMPSRQPLCDDCPYIPAFEALLDVMDRHGGREAFVITGETGCMVRAQLPPWELLDVKYGLGSSIGLAAGLARAGIEQKIIALSGDSSFLHSGLGELIDAARADLPLLLVLLDNDITALSGQQPHPGTGHDARGRQRHPVDLIALLTAAGVENVHPVDPEDRRATRAALEAAITHRGLAAVVVQRPCPRAMEQRDSHDN